MTSHERACSRWVGKVKNPFAPPKPGTAGIKLPFYPQSSPMVPFICVQCSLLPPQQKRGAKAFLSIDSKGSPLCTCSTHHEKAACMMWSQTKKEGEGLLLL